MSELWQFTRELAKQVADVRTRMNRLVMIGTVEKRDGQKVRLKLAEKGEGAEEDFLSPLVPIGRPSGKNGGGHSQFTRAGLGEPFLLLSPGGEIGEHSRALHAGHTADNPAPGDEAADSDVETYGDWKIEKKNGLKVSAGSVSFDLSPAGLTLSVGGSSFAFTAAGFAQTGGSQTHDGRNVGQDHKHTDVQPGGALTGEPAA
jgi:hypothetical protein